MTRAALATLVLAALAFAGCNDKKTAEAPAPYELTSSAIGNYCGMNVLEHAGPKGQIILASRIEPVWFSSARDAFAFTMLPEEPKDIRAIYVSDMAKAPSWEEPGANNWVNAKQAFFVVGSRVKGGMGADETVPFSNRVAADRFAGENRGRVLAFTEVPREYVLGTGADTTSSVEQANSPLSGGHGSHPSGRTAEHPH
jgi:copper chaperone NosL